jgi:hypothetical protein
VRRPGAVSRNRLVPRPPLFRGLRNQA